GGGAVLAIAAKFPKTKRLTVSHAFPGTGAGAPSWAALGRPVSGCAQAGTGTIRFCRGCGLR
ncbi:hypothetical protein, partial [Amycolatopsis sp. NPDC003731]